MMMYLTKKQKEIAEDMIINTTMGLEVIIKTQEEHKIAQSLVNQGLLKITAKKNYGRIAKVRAA